jgi:hypothetical protein
MITLNGKKFALNEKEMVNSLFQPGGTCVGFYKVNKRSVTIQDHNHNKVGMVTIHRVLVKATKHDGDRYWYSYGDIDIIGKFDTYSNECRDIDCVVSALLTTINNRG